MYKHSTKTVSREIRKRSVCTYLAFFFAASMIGWLWEIIVFWVQNAPEYGLWELLRIYRGVLHGPWTPIYGAGGVLMVWLRRKTPLGPAGYFMLCTGICAVVEYLTSWVLEVIFHAKWWDYTGYFLNVNGRICAMSLLFFALAGMAVAYVLAPYFWRWLEKVPCYVLMCLVWLATGSFLLDLVVSLSAPNMGLGVQFLF